jgi:hypothetical protein
LADLVAAVSELRSGLASIDRRLANPEELLPAPYFEYLMKSSGGLTKSRRGSKMAEGALNFAIDRLEEANSGESDNQERALREVQMALRDVRQAL